MGRVKPCVAVYERRVPTRFIEQEPPVPADNETDVDQASETSAGSQPQLPLHSFATRPTCIILRTSQPTLSSCWAAATVPALIRHDTGPYRLVPATFQTTPQASAEDRAEKHIPSNTASVSAEAVLTRTPSMILPVAPTAHAKILSTPVSAWLKTAPNPLAPAPTRPVALTTPASSLQITAESVPAFETMSSPAPNDSVPSTTAPRITPLTNLEPSTSCRDIASLDLVGDGLPVFAGAEPAPMVGHALREVSSAILWVGGLAAGTTLHDLQMRLNHQAVRLKCSLGLRCAALDPNVDGLAYVLEFNSEWEALVTRGLWHGLVVGNFTWTAYTVPLSYMKALHRINFSPLPNAPHHPSYGVNSTNTDPLLPRLKRNSSQLLSHCTNRRRHNEPRAVQSPSTRHANAQRSIEAKAFRKLGRGA